jgi:hypothetical protein
MVRASTPSVSTIARPAATTAAVEVRAGAGIAFLLGYCV